MRMKPGILYSPAPAVMVRRDGPILLRKIYCLQALMQRFLPW